RTPHAWYRALCASMWLCSGVRSSLLLCVFLKDTATTEIYTLSLHDALPILKGIESTASQVAATLLTEFSPIPMFITRSEEHTSELQSLAYLVCRLLLEK